MANMLDYILWRGDVPLDAVPVGEVDGLILAQLAMMRWEQCLGEGEASTVLELYPKMNEPPVSVGFTGEDDQKLLKLAAESARFGTLTVSDFASAFDPGLGMQFAAVTFHLPDDTVYVAYRGTDNTIVGWREDFNLAFSRPVPAQKAAREYLSRVAGKYPGKLRLGGHSKGGNLAMYAAATVEDALRERIIQVYNFDGPGFSDRMNDGELYSRIQHKLRTCLPQGSIVGLLLAHPEEYAVVKSENVSILQHDPYSWQVLGPRFVYLPELSRDSVRFDLAFRNWLSAVDEANRQLLVNTLFSVLEATRAATFGKEFWQGLTRNSKAVVAAIQKVEPQDRKRVNRMLADLAAYMLNSGEDESKKEEILWL